MHNTSLNAAISSTADNLDVGLPIMPGHAAADAADRMQAAPV